MSWIKSRRHVLAGLLAIALPAVADPPIEIPAKERHLVLRAESGEAFAELIQSTTYTDEGDATLWKVMTPEHNRVVWSSRFEVEGTVFAGRLEDLESGWTAELAISSGTQSPRFQSQGAHGLMADLREHDALLTMTLETSDGFFAEQSSPVDAPRSEESEWKPFFASQLAEQNVGESLPSSVIEEVRFLWRIAEHLNGENRFSYWLVELLYQELERVRTETGDGVAPYATSRWTVGQGTVAIGDETDARATHRELARRFEKAEDEAEPIPE